MFFVHGKKIAFCFLTYSRKNCRIGMKLLDTTAERILILCV